MPIASLTDVLAEIDGELRAHLGLEPEYSPVGTLEVLSTSAETTSHFRFGTATALDPTGPAAGLAVRSLRTQAELRRHLATWRTMRLRHLNRAIAKLAATDTDDATRQQACRSATEVLGYGVATYSEIHDTGWFTVDCLPLRAREDEIITVPWSESPMEYMAYEENIVVLAREEPHPVPVLQAAFGTVPRFVAPVTSVARSIGLLHCAHPRAEIVDFVEVEVLKVFGAAVAAVQERNRRIRANRKQRDKIEEAARLLAQIAGDIPCNVHELDNRLDDDDPRPIRRPEAARSSLEDALTAREREVYRLLVAGASNGEIAEHLVISVETVKSHVKRVLRKVGAVNRSEVISLHLQHR